AGIQTAATGSYRFRGRRRHRSERSQPGTEQRTGREGCSSAAPTGEDGGGAERAAATDRGDRTAAPGKAPATQATAEVESDDAAVAPADRRARAHRGASCQISRAGRQSRRI